MVLDTEVHERINAINQQKLVDDQPCVEGPSISLTVDPTLRLNYQDKNAFETHWIEETAVMEKLEDLLKLGEKFINEVYTYRGCSKALPQVKTPEQANKQQIYQGSFEVLEPEIKRLRDFMAFQRDTIRIFCEHIKRLSTTIKDKKRVEEFIISETMIMYFIRMLDLFALLDALKNMKASLNNDFSHYKRNLGFIKKSADETQENNTLYMFLANPNSITTSLKTELMQIDAFDDVLALAVNQCADSLEAGRFLLPSEKHCLLRVMPYALFLMDGEKNNNNIFKKKDLNLSKFSRTFKKHPVVPLFGDMQITLESLIKRSPHFDEKVWGSPGEDIRVIQDSYELVHHVAAARAVANEYTARFSNTINELRIAQKASSAAPSPAECKDIVTTVLQGLQLLSDWSSKVLQQSAWKYARPNNDPQINSTVDYERVVKYNYTSEERYALVEFIAMIKGLAGLFTRYDALLSPVIRRAIHRELQEFIQVSLREMIRSVSKNSKKKTHIRGELLQLRAIAADWMSGEEPVTDSALYGKKAAKDEDKVQFPDRAVGPSLTQLDLIRNIVYGLIYKKKEFSSSQVRELEDFYSRSFFYKYVLAITPTVLAMTDMADLWYKEFYLELSKKLQFPIEMSLPWILTDHILESRDASMMEYVLYPLDIYNDAAQRALSKLGTRFLFDEIEAEVNLCFDQLLFKLSDQIFTWFKIQASTILMDKPYKAQLEIAYAAGRYNVPKSRYDVIMRQRHFQLLGRSLDLNALIGQRMHTYLKQNIDYAISRFEASDLTAIVELENQFLNIRFVHKMMSQYFVLDPIDQLFNEINESTSLVSFHSRIVLHVIFELMYDFLPNFNYNAVTRRFVRTPYSFSSEVPRDPLPKTNPLFLQGNKVLSFVYMNSIELTKKFIGSTHILALLRVVKEEGLSLLIGEVLRNMELKLVNVLAPYVKELVLSGMPQSSKLPIHDYGTEGGYGYFQLKLKDIFTYPDLRPEVLHNFRIFGNAVAFIHLLDLYSNQRQVMTFLQAAPFLGYDSFDLQTGVHPAESDSPLYVNLQRVGQHLAAKGDSKCPPAIQEIIVNAWRSQSFYRPDVALTSGSLFKAVLLRIDAMMDHVRPEWCGGPPDNGVMAVDSTTEFYRLWSALQLVICFPPTSDNDASCHELFGDGLIFSGCTIIHFLGQQNRFEVFDFAYHILRIEEASAQSSNKRQFFLNVKTIRGLNQSIFAMLNKYAPLAPPELVLFHPPASEQLDKVFLNVPEEREAPPSHFDDKTPYFNDLPPPPVYNDLMPLYDDLPPPL
jgi:cytoplasmic FMR1 interacting protein